MWITYRKCKNVILLNFNAENFCKDLHKSILNFFPQDNAINPDNLNMIFNNFIKTVKLQLTIAIDCN